MLAVASTGVFFAMRAQARRVERSDQAPVDKLHRLQRKGLVASLGGQFLVILPLLAWVVTCDRDDVPLGRLLVPVVALLAIVGIPLVLALATLPTYRKLRGLEGAPKPKLWRIPLTIGTLLLVQVLWVAFRVAADRLGLPGWTTAVAGVVLLFGGVIVIPPLMFRAMGAKRAEGMDRERILEACARLGFRPRDVLILADPSDRIANAMVAGPIRRLAVLVLTDQMLERFPQDELEAVLAHEVAHVRGHHLLLKLGALLASFLAVTIVFAAISSALDIDPGPVVFVILLFLFPASLFLIQGALGVALERRADDYAARAIGPDPTKRALERLAEVNMVKRRTGRLWNLLAQHPGLDARVKRLEAMRPDGSKGRAVR
jgi:Zn-dependent protease with chaperone function